MLDTKIISPQPRTLGNQFPNFKPFMPEDYEMYSDFISAFPQHCDFTLNNLLIWIGAGESLEYSWLRNNLVLRVNDSLYLDSASGPWYTILGVDDPDRSLEELFDAIPAKELLLVPDYFIDHLVQPEKYIISEDSDNADYIIDIDKLLKKEGKEYEGFRYQVNYFLKKYSEEAIIRPIDPSTNEGVLEMINALHCWPTITSFTPEGNDPGRRDAQAIDKLLSLQVSFPIKHQALGIYIENELQGFSIFHIPKSDQKIAMGNHIKFNAKYQRLFDFLVYATASSLKSQGIELINAEQDMGMPGIKHHKQALGPIDFYKKYSVRTV